MRSTQAKRGFIKGAFICDCHVLGLQLFLSCLFLDYLYVGRAFWPFSTRYVATRAPCSVCFTKPLYTSERGPRARASPLPGGARPARGGAGAARFGPGHAGRGGGGGGRGGPGGGGGRRGEAGAGPGRGGGRRPAASVASPHLCWAGVCVQCSDVGSLHKSLTTLLLLSCCLGDNDSLQLHLFGYPGKIALRGDVDTSVVGRPHHDSLWAHAAAHCCTPAGAGPSGEEGVIVPSR